MTALGTMASPSTVIADKVKMFRRFIVFLPVP
jgi:hypothetical protein